MLAAPRMPRTPCRYIHVDIHAEGKRNGLTIIGWEGRLVGELAGLTGGGGTNGAPGIIDNTHKANPIPAIHFVYIIVVPKSSQATILQASFAPNNSFHVAS